MPTIVIVGAHAHSACSRLLLFLAVLFRVLGLVWCVSVFVDVVGGGPQMKELPEKLFEPPYPTRPGSAASKPKMVPISPRALAAAAAAEQEYYVQDT